MKYEKKLKEYEVVWTCDFCGEEFKTKKESEKHELNCNKKSNKKVFFWLLLSFLFIYFLTYFISNSYAQSNGLSTRDLLQPQNWFSIDRNITPTSTLSPTLVRDIFPTDKLFLQANYNGKVVTGTILNKGDKPATNIKIILKISKDKTAWNIDEEHVFNIPSKINPNQTISFSEDFKTTKSDPWSSSEIIAAQYYSDEENIPTPTLTTKKIIKPTSVPVNTDPIINCNVSVNCGGGIKKIKKSECDNAVCCQIGSSWIFYTSSQKCNEDQEKNNSNNYVHPTNIPTSTYKVQPTYAPVPTTPYVAPTTYVYQTPTPNQDYINQCKDRCRSVGASSLRQKQELGLCDNPIYRDCVAEINEWIQNCVNDCGY